MTPPRAVFETAYAVLYGHERGIVTPEQAARIHDAGGATKDGVSLRYLIERGFDVNGDGVINADDVMALTPEQVEYECMKKSFWLPIYEYLTQMVATKVFDTAVNVGPQMAHKLAQRSANLCGAALDEDGVFGPVTLDAINKILPNVFLKEMCKQQRAYYLDILRRKPGMEPCRRGWLARSAWPFNTLSVEGMV